MNSNALKKWIKERKKSLDEIEQAHSAVGGTGRGRRFATQQINQAYVVILSAQFQGFCRDLHTECIDHLVQYVQPINYKDFLKTELERGRKLDHQNPNPGNLGADFNRLGIPFWDAIEHHIQSNAKQKVHLETMNIWRNAIAHQDFTSSKLEGEKALKIVEVRKWRKACDGLAESFNNVMKKYLQSMTNTPPW